MSRFFESERQPERDRYGFTAHPDLDVFSTADYAVNDAALHDAGFVLAFVAIASDAPHLLDAYHEGDDYALARWDPQPPAGDAWQLVGVYDTETDPVAVFVRRLG